MLGYSGHHTTLLLIFNIATNILAINIRTSRSALLQVYRQLAQLRRQHQFQPTTGLYSTQQVFAFARLSEVSTGLSDFLVVMNVAGEEVELGLGDLLLEVGLGTEGEVVIRSSGD